MTPLSRLEALEKAATPGPWGADPCHWVIAINLSDTVAEAYTAEDAALIVETRNLLPALIAVAKAAHVIATWTQERGRSPWEDLDRALAPLLDEGDA